MLPEIREFNGGYLTLPALQFLYEHSAPGALHDSEERFPPPMCHEGTREVVVVRIADWYGYHAPGKPIMWVHAPVGYGKTAIAGTVSKKLEENEGLDFTPLGATFFFSRISPERNNPTRFIVTIAYQLAMSIPELAPHVEGAIKRNPMILRKALEVQLAKLIVEPFKAIDGLEDIPNRLVIIDGLDECIDSGQQSLVEKKYAEEREKVQIRVLDLIHILQSHRFPLSFLLLSRPEAWIKQHIESRSFTDSVEVVDLYAVGDHMNDVEKYVRAELARIAANIGDEEWPTEGIGRPMATSSTLPPLSGISKTRTTTYGSASMTSSTLQLAQTLTMRTLSLFPPSTSCTGRSYDLVLRAIARSWPRCSKA